MEEQQLNIFKRAKLLFLGKARNLKEAEVFHKLSLSALLAWVGFGLDGISSSCYGPPEAFLGLGTHQYLSVFLALMTVVTVFVISASYMQIIELFPGGGGGYLVASKLISPKAGMVSGCALIVDYVLTITVSVTAGVEAVMSFMPAHLIEFKVPICITVLIFMMLINLRGVKESVVPLVPIFIIFLVTHVLLILYAITTHVGELPSIATQSVSEFKTTASEIGIWGVLFLLLHAYSVGSGTYTGIEAVSNGTPLIKEPRVENGKKTTLYMAFSLAFMAGGLILCYLFYKVGHVDGKTLNAVLLEKVVGAWPGGTAIILITLISEALVLLVGAQTGFLGGPRVIANMALDRWLPFRYAFLSDRLVTQNGVLTMGIGAIAILLVADGSISILVVLYSINVFITFTLSQLGLVKHWWAQRNKEQNVTKKLMISGFGFLLTSFILITVIITKFTEGGWITLIITSSLITLAYMINRYYRNTSKTLGHLNNLAQVVLAEDALNKTAPPAIPPAPIPNKGTAIVLVSGFHGVSLHTLFSVLKTFPGYFKNFIFVQVGIVDAGAFKGAEEITNLQQNVQDDLKKYVDYMHKHGYYAESHYSLGTDVVDEVEKISEKLIKRFPNSILFAGQLLFPYDTNFTKFLHNYAAFAIQKRLYYHGMPVLIMPIRVPARAK